LTERRHATEAASPDPFCCSTFAATRKARLARAFRFAADRNAGARLSL